jgi:hypothetical protein
METKNSVAKISMLVFVYHIDRTKSQKTTFLIKIPINAFVKEKSSELASNVVLQVVLACYIDSENFGSKSIILKGIIFIFCVSSMRIFVIISTTFWLDFM